jgi:hypothetical protein
VKIPPPSSDTSIDLYTLDMHTHPLFIEFVKSKKIPPPLNPFLINIIDDSATSTSKGALPKYNTPPWQFDEILIFFIEQCE